MSAVYSRRFYAGHIAPDGALTLATCPTGVVWIVRDVVIGTVTNNVSGQVALYIVSGSAQGDIRRWATIAGLTTEEWQGRQVLEEGDQLRVFNSSDELSILVSGYELSAF